MAPLPTRDGVATDASCPATGLVVYAVRRDAPGGDLLLSVEAGADAAINEDDAAGYSAPPTVLIIDQFEELLTYYPERWEDRADFFRQLDAALRADPRLWIVLTLREDYAASLDPYIPLVENRLRARYFMQRMGVDAALAAVREPALPVSYTHLTLPTSDLV